MSKKQPHVTQNSGEENWYTPAIYVESARVVLGGQIDLDPASTEEANRVVMARVFYTKEDNGLKLPWYGKIWLNPPYTRGQIDSFAEKMRIEVKAKRVEQAIVLVNNATETVWFQKLAAISSAVAFPVKRIKFWSVDKASSSPLQGQAFFYIGTEKEKFAREFSKYGIVYYSKGNVHE